MESCTNRLHRQSSVPGFTLLELSVVLVIIAVVIGSGLTIFTSSLQASQFNATVKRMDDIEKALLDYAIAYNRIPCPSDLKQPSSAVTYGFEAGSQTGGTGTGECISGMTPAADFRSTSGVEEGGVPTHALQLSDDYLYDGWGRRFRYAVDPNYTKNNSLPVTASCGSGFVGDDSAITVNDASGAARTTAAMYALVSHGSNGHGGYTSSGITMNAGSVNVDELANCHCDASATPTTYTPIYAEKVPTEDASNALNNFDDLVTFKEPWQMQATNYPLVTATCNDFIYVVDLSNNRVQKFDSNGIYQSQFGSAGSGDGQFNGSYGIAVDLSGNIWVTDSGNIRVQKFNNNGVYQGQFGSQGSGNGQFDAAGPYGIALDPSGKVWVMDGGNSRVEEFDSTGAYIRQFGSAGFGPGQLGGKSGIATDTNGNVWVTDFYNNRVEKFDSSGVYQSQFGASGSGNGQFTHPWAIAVDASGNVWVGDENQRIQKFSSSGVYQSQFGTYGSGNGQFNYPQFIAIDSSGNIWVSDYLNRRVQKFDNSGAYQSQFGTSGSGNGQFSLPVGIAVGR